MVVISFRPAYLHFIDSVYLLETIKYSYTMLLLSTEQPRQRYPGDRKWGKRDNPKR